MANFNVVGGAARDADAPHAVKSAWDSDTTTMAQPITKTKLAIASELAVPPAASGSSSGDTRAQILQYGDTVVLKNVYNNYVITTSSGKVFSGGYMHANDRLRLVSPHGQSGAFARWRSPSRLHTSISPRFA